MTTPSLTDFPFQQFLKELPRGVFETSLNQSPLRQSQSDFLRPRFGEFQNQFEGQIAANAQQGILPTLTFQDFLNGLDWNQQFYRRFNSPQARNAFATRNPFTQFRGF